jgi:methionyl-tRNA formyltransferase
MSQIVFFGSGQFAARILEQIHPEVALVVSQPPKPKGRKGEPAMTPVHELATKLGLEVRTPWKATDPEFLAELETGRYSVGVVASYGKILRKKLLDLFSIGCFNLHGSILPQYRGAAPIQRAIMDGQTKTGVTLIEMDEGMDTGDIVAIAETPIGADETYGLLEDRLGGTAGELTAQWLPRLLDSDYPALRQAHEEATYAPKIEPEERILNLEMSAKLAYNRYRALHPAPATEMRFQDRSIKVLKAGYDPKSGPIGECHITGNALEVFFQTGTLILYEVTPAGSRPMSGAEFARGSRLVSGDQWRQ